MREGSPDLLNPFIRSLTLLDKYNVPSVIAAIPKGLSREAIAVVGQYKNAYVYMHGISHKNNGDAQGPNEFPPGRDISNIIPQFAKYKKRFEDIFGDKFIPVFAPPFNAVNCDLEKELRKLGFIGISGHSSLTKDSLYNVSVDFIKWDLSDSFYTEDYVLERIICLLDDGKPIGFMNHPKTIGEKGFVFIEKLMDFFCCFTNVKWFVPGAESWGRDRDD